MVKNLPTVQGAWVWYHGHGVAEESNMTEWLTVSPGDITVASSCMCSACLSCGFLVTFCPWGVITDLACHLFQGTGRAAWWLRACRAPLAACRRLPAPVFCGPPRGPIITVCFLASVGPSSENPDADSDGPNWVYTSSVKCESIIVTLAGLNMVKMTVLICIIPPQIYFHLFSLWTENGRRVSFFFSHLFFY